MSAAILEGIRVIDLTHGQAGPYASAMLADIGAEVIHIEEPKWGDITRQTKEWFGLPIQLPHGRGSVFFEEHNRNKKGMTINLTKKEGCEILYRLIEISDVFISNMRPQVLRRYGLEYEDLKPRNTKLIYALGTSFGVKGPEADKPSLDLVAHARSGAMMASGEPGMNPIMLPVGLGDRLTAMLLAYGVISALYARDKLGVGQKVDVSMLGSMTALQGNALTALFLLGKPYPRYDRTKARNPLYNYYRCKDDRWIALSAYQADKDWPIICKLIGRPEMKDDPKFRDDESRAQNAEEIVTILDSAFATKTMADWRAIFSSEDILFAPVQTIPDLVKDPQIIANDYIIPWEHPELGPINFVGFPVHYSETPAKLRVCAPKLGQHTEEVLRDLMNFTADQITGLKEREVV